MSRAGGLLFDEVQRLRSILRDAHGVPLGFQEVGEQAADRWVVVGDDDSLPHERADSPPLLPLSATKDRGVTLATREACSIAGTLHSLYHARGLTSIQRHPRTSGRWRLGSHVLHLASPFPWPSRQQGINQLQEVLPAPDLVEACLCLDRQESFTWIAPG